ncbi:MAG: polyprenyl diphosphate synthase [bacterium]|nr:polyprenyl diphosphate synthase [bacterium]
MQKYSIGHVAIIPDGNRRWARAKGKSSWMGHAEGAKNFEKILNKALELNVYCLSFWGMSTDNIEKRESREVQFLLKIFSKTLLRALQNKDLKENDVRISILGEWRNRFPKKLVDLGEKIIDETKDRKKHIVNLLLCYDGKTEMTQAFQKAIVSKKDFISPKDYLWTRDLPPVDLVIRTGGEPHLSVGFMMWDVSDAQLYFSEKLWPDFTPDDFESAILDFKKRERRLGA